MASRDYPIPFGMASACPGRGQGCRASFYLPKRLGALIGKVAHAFQSLMVMVELEA